MKTPADGESSFAPSLLRLRLARSGTRASPRAHAQAPRSRTSRACSAAHGGWRCRSVSPGWRCSAVSCRASCSSGARPRSASSYGQGAEGVGSRGQKQKRRPERELQTAVDTARLSWGVQDSETLGNLRLTTLSCGVLRIPTETASDRSLALRSTALRCWRPVLRKAQARIPSPGRSRAQPRSGSRTAMRSGFVRHSSRSSPASTDGHGYHCANGALPGPPLQDPALRGPLGLRRRRRGRARRRQGGRGDRHDLGAAQLPPRRVERASVPAAGASARRGGCVCRSGGRSSS